MADGSGQTAFNIPHKQLVCALRPGEIVVDLFAGGGGASVALERALGRPVDLAINHDEWAIGMHAANHPFTRHEREDIWVADPRAEAAGRAVGWLHASPDCTHFSQAKGGQPRSRKTRALSWVVPKWVGSLQRSGNGPRIVSLENVRQILQWGPLVAKRDKATGRVVRVDGTIAGPGERVPVNQQWLVPDKRHIGRTWRQFVRILRGMGGTIEWRRLVACDYGAGTSRDRVFVIVRFDGEPICWPEPTHGPGREHPYVTAADCIDWSIDAPSIFTRKKPLADATLRRIARGVHRYVLAAAEPFIVHATHDGDRRPHGTSEPVPTITAAHRGELMVVAPTLVQAAHGEGSGPTKRRGSGAHDIQEPVGTIHAGGGSFAVAAATLVQTGYGERPGQEPRVPGLDKPVGTIVNGQKHAVVAAHLVKFRGESAGSAADDPVPTITSGAGAARPAGAAHALGVMTAFLEQAAGGPNSNTSRPRGADEPVSTIASKGSQQRLVTANMVTLRGDNTGAAADAPLRTLSAGGEHHAVVECTLSPEHEAGALRVAAFLMRYHSTGGQDASLQDPLTTVTSKDRLALVTVTIRGTPYVIVDIGLRMLRPHELYRAQGFPPGYIFDRTADGRRLTISQSVRMVGNSVSPPPLEALARANLPAVEPAMAAA